VIVNPKYAAGFGSDNTHPQLASGHRFKLRTEIYGRIQAGTLDNTATLVR